ncbi:hypothetical protein [Fluviicola sp.]|jgi:hypothetical protein|uniref:hypothetical protein n=1 Tax=Fluviicola sp. TaxID=1917219 RepID=UPI0028311B82|nr:hypothetical protein [Fluviicola sp.]MDR0802039.1 hypothetical protein [Fluviicola sp.]
MKRLIYMGLIMITGLSFNTFAQDTDSTGMPGDNFDLQGALQLFKQSSTLEEFEKKLNTESNAVNNLDLNGDSKIDYIRVIDKKEGDNHAIMLQVPVNSKESQDVAAIVIEKRSDSEAQLQIIGNETLYGEEKIMEPVEERAVKQTGPSVYEAPAAVIFVNVWGWPCIQYIYNPWYSPWYSPYYWDYYPSWWYPWRPLYWNVYYQRVYPYHGWCQYTTFYHVPYAHQIYKNGYTNSAYVQARYEPQRTAYKNRNISNQSVGRVEPGNGTVSTSVRPVVRNEGMRNEAVRPSTTTNPAGQGTTVREVPRPANRGTVIDDGNNGRINTGNNRTVEPIRRDPAIQQPNPVERVPQQRPIQQQNPGRIQMEPGQGAPVFRQNVPDRQISRPMNGGGGFRSGMQRR